MSGDTTSHFTKMHNPYMVSNQIDHLTITEFLEQQPERAQKLRWQVYKRDGYTCVYCGMVATHCVIWHDKNRPESIHMDAVGYVDGEMMLFTIDHRFPASKGGKKDLDNCDTACYRCNHLKKSMSVEQFRKKIEEGYLSRRHPTAAELRRMLRRTRDRIAILGQLVATQSEQLKEQTDEIDALHKRINYLEGLRIEMQRNNNGTAHAENDFEGQDRSESSTR